MTNASSIPTVPPPSPSLSPRRPRRAAIPLADVHASASGPGSPDAEKIPQLGTPTSPRKHSLSRILSASRRRHFHPIPGSPHHASLSSPNPALLAPVPRLKSGSKRIDRSSTAAFNVTNGHSVPGRTAPVFARRAISTSPSSVLTEPPTRPCPSRIQPVSRPGDHSIQLASPRSSTRCSASDASFRSFFSVRSGTRQVHLRFEPEGLS